MEAPFVGRARELAQLRAAAVSGAASGGRAPGPGERAGRHREVPPRRRRRGDRRGVRDPGRARLRRRRRRHAGPLAVAPGGARRARTRRTALGRDRHGPGGIAIRGLHRRDRRVARRGPRSRPDRRARGSALGGSHLVAAVASSRRRPGTFATARRRHAARSRGAVPAGRTAAGPAARTRGGHAAARRAHHHRSAALVGRHRPRRRPGRAVAAQHRREPAAGAAAAGRAGYRTARPRGQPAGPPARARPDRPGRGADARRAERGERPRRAHRPADADWHARQGARRDRGGTRRGRDARRRPLHRRAVGLHPRTRTRRRLHRDLTRRIGYRCTARPPRRSADATTQTPWPV